MKKFVRKHYNEIDLTISCIFILAYIGCMLFLINSICLPIKYGFALPENEFKNMVYGFVFFIISVIFVRFIEISVDFIIDLIYD